MTSLPRRRLLTILIVAVLLGLTSGPAIAQTLPGQAPGVVATGWGRASAPATSADIQIIATRSYYGGMMVDPTIASMPMMEDAAATPGAGTMDPYAGMMGGPIPLTEADLAPLIDAIVASGVASDQIAVLTPAFTSMYTGPGGPESAQIRVAIADPEVAMLTALGQSLWTAAAGAGLSIDHYGVTYQGGDCAALAQEARTAAVTDARAAAESLATALGGMLGPLVQAADNTLGWNLGGCLPGMPPGYSPYGEGMGPAFDPTQPAEVVVYSQVTLTYELIAGDAATPTA